MQPKSAKRKIPWGLLRRVVMLSILGLLLLQFFGVNWLVGSLTGSVFLSEIKLLDIFAFFEIAAASGLSLIMLTAVLPIVLLYLIFGRAFCGWCCPLDWLFSGVSRVKLEKDRSLPPPPLPAKSGYLVAGALLLIALLSGIPVFTAYLSHLTNIFRAIGGGFFLWFDLPVEPAVIAWALLTLLILLLLEYAYPRLWCRVLCPLGKTYGLFNRVNLLKLRFGDSGQCEGCKRCDQRCYMGVEISSQVGRSILRDSNCIFCGRCVEACHDKNKLVRMTLK